jgi:hypothetical protein
MQYTTYLSRLEAILDVFAPILKLIYLARHCGEIRLESGEKGFESVKELYACL